jgi:hypothetical protein
MNRSKLSIKAILLMSAIGLAGAAFGGSQPAAAQSYSDDYSCSAGYVYDPSYGCVLPDYASEPYDYGFSGYSPYYGGYGSRDGGGHHEFGHGFAHGMGGGFAHGGFTHGMGGGFGHGMGGGFAHGGGGGHR